MCQKRFNITAIAYDKRNRVLAVGKNSYVKTHPFQAKHAEAVGEPHKIFLHAEIACLLKISDTSLVAKFVVFRYNADGTPGNARPCKICSRALRLAGITNIEHT